MFLEKIDNIKKYVDESDRLKCNVFNESGALLIKRGDVFNSKLLKQSTYIRSTGAIKTAAELINKKKEELKTSGIGPATLEIYSEIYDTFRQTIIEDSVSARNFQYLDEAISEMCKTKLVSPMQMKKCLDTVRDRDHYTLHHSMSLMLLMYQALQDIQRFTTWSEELTKYFRTVDMSKDSIHAYLIGALMHDYGKAFVPRHILQKNGPLTAGEYDLIRQHPSKGVYELKNINITDKRILRLVGNHHCNYTVYKDGQLPLEVVINMLDVYDACRSDRPYKSIMSMDKTDDILKSNLRSGSWPKFVLEFIRKTTITTSETFLDVTKQL